VIRNEALAIGRQEYASRIAISFCVKRLSPPPALRLRSPAPSITPPRKLRCK
jgi:hypothetical protein